ncbi:hypothetical protein ACN47E_004600 [Coniothyrium glycines]
MDHLCSSRTRSILENGDSLELHVSIAPQKQVDVKPTAAVTRETSTEAQSTTSTTQRISFRQQLYRLYVHWFTVYRVLIAIAFTINIGVLTGLIVRGARNETLLLGTSANFFATALARQEDLINASFSLVAKTPVSFPRTLRRAIADFHHYGGIHIGCALSALIWYCAFVVFGTISSVKHVKAGTMSGWQWADIVTCYLFLTSILVVCIFATPRLRVKFHNLFERTHRFGGWLALVVLWANTGIATRVVPRPSPLSTNPSVWLLTLTTFLIILPWLRMRPVAISTSLVSPRELKLSFAFDHMPYTSTMRFSLSPLFEWHAFATIPSSPCSSHIIVSITGDWTSSLLASPPTRMYLRKPPVKNFLSCTPLFHSVLLVATGAGIGPVLSLLSSPAIRSMLARGSKVRVMWCVYSPGAPHWQFVHDTIRSVDPAPCILDSSHSRPDIAFEASALADTEDLEAVLVVSNPAVTRSVVERVKSTGRAAYGAVFDS